MSPGSLLSSKEFVHSHLAYRYLHELPLCHPAPGRRNAVGDILDFQATSTQRKIQRKTSRAVIIADAG